MFKQKKNSLELQLNSYYKHIIWFYLETIFILGLTRFDEVSIQWTNPTVEQAYAVHYYKLVINLCCDSFVYVFFVISKTIMVNWLPITSNVKIFKCYLKFLTSREFPQNSAQHGSDFNLKLRYLQQFLKALVVYMFIRANLR